VALRLYGGDERGHLCVTCVGLAVVMAQTINVNDTIRYLIVNTVKYGVMSDNKAFAT